MLDIKVQKANAPEWPCFPGRLAVLLAFQTFYWPDLNFIDSNLRVETFEYFLVLELAGTLQFIFLSRRPTPPHPAPPSRVAFCQKHPADIFRQPHLGTFPCHPLLSFATACRARTLIRRLCGEKLKPGQPQGLPGLNVFLLHQVRRRFPNANYCSRVWSRLAYPLSVLANRRKKRGAHSSSCCRFASPSVTV